MNANGGAKLDSAAIVGNHGGSTSVWTVPIMDVTEVVPPKIPRQEGRSFSARFARPRQSSEPQNRSSQKRMKIGKLVSGLYSISSLMDFG